MLCVFIRIASRSDSNEYKQHTIIHKKRKSPEIIPNAIMSAAMGLFLLGTQERIRNSHVERAINIRATEVLLYIVDVPPNFRILPLFYDNMYKMVHVNLSVFRRRLPRVGRPQTS